MGVQTKILKRTVTIPLSDDKNLTSGTGALIGGTPGQIYDVAYGPVVHTATLTAAADIGSFVKGQGVIVNSPEYALYGAVGDPLKPSLTLPTGATASFMTAGHVWMTRKAYKDMGDAMVSAIIWEEKNPDPDGTVSDNDLIVVEVNGMTSYGPESSI